MPIFSRRTFWRVSSIHPNCRCVSLHSSFSLAPICKNNIGAIHFFHKLVYSALSNLKMESWGYCILVFDSSGEPAACPGDAFACFLGGCGDEFENGRAKSCGEVPSIVQSPPVDFASILLQNICFVF